MPTLVANWKMNGLPSDVEPWLAPLRQQAGQEGQGGKVRCVVCPPFPLLPVVAGALEGSVGSVGQSVGSVEQSKGQSVGQFGQSVGGLQLGAQDCHSELSGAYTGAVSPSLLKQTGCDWVILGHSERRRDYGETPEQIAAKARAARAAGLGVIVCLGETLETRHRLTTGSTGDGEQAVSEYLARELETLLGGLEGAPEGLQGTPEALSGALMVAYEPVWAIGSGEAATPAVAGAILGVLRERVDSLGVKADFLYGGSVAPDNAADFLKAGADGLLVGGVSLQPDKLTATLEAMALV